MSKPTGLTINPPILAPLHFANALFPDDPHLATGTGTVTGNRVYLRRFQVARPFLLSNIGVFVQSASGNLDVGVYSSTDNGENLTRVASAGSTAVAGTAALQTLPMTTPTWLIPGTDYFRGFVVDNGTAEFLRIAPGGAALSFVGRLASRVDNALPLPTSLSGSVADTINIPMVFT